MVIDKSEKPFIFSVAHPKKITYPKTILSIIRYFEKMPSHKSAEKAVRQTAKRTLINKSRINRIRTFVKKVETAILSFGKNPSITKEQVKTALVSAEKELMRGASRGVLHKNAASRKVSRLTSKAKKVLDN